MRLLAQFVFLGLCLCSVAQAHEEQGIWYILHEDEVWVETQGHGTTPQTPFALASVGKLMTSVAVLRHVERGQLSLDDPVAGLVPAALRDQAEQWDGVLLRHLLTMTSGIPDYFDDGYLAQGTQGAVAAVAYVDGEASLFEPGQDFDYSNTNYVLLGLILETLTRQSYAAIMEREVLDPAGMETAFVFGSQPLPADFPTGHEYGKHVRSYYGQAGFGDGGIIASAEDLATFYKALFLDRTLLKGQTLQTLLADPIGAGYGMGIVISDGILGHSGGDVGFVSDIGFDIETGAIAPTLHANAEQDLNDWPWD